MDFTQVSTLVVSALSLVASVVMAWRALRRQTRVPAERKDRQFRRFTKRRLIMSALVAAVGVMLPFGVFLPEDYVRRHATGFTWFWLAVIGILLGLAGLAVADAYAVLYAQLSEHFKRDR